MTNPAPIDWNAEAVLLTNNEPPSLGVSRTVMTLREAVEAILEMPRERWARAGIGLHNPILMIVDGRPVAQGYLRVRFRTHAERAMRLTSTIAAAA